MFQKSYLIAYLCVIFLLSLFIFQQINLTTADLGRHIINGKIFLHAQNLGISRDTLLNTNFFSFSNPNFPFINHHWSSGILFYLIYSFLGFWGLSLFYGGIIIFSVIFLFNVYQRELPLYVSFPIILFLIPLIGERTEIRPEGLSYLFISLIIGMLYLHSKNKIQKKLLFLIPIITLIFINIHIYFIFAPFIIGMFLIQALIRKEAQKSKELAIILGLSALALFFNPYGFTGIIYPFNLFQNYGYLITENQSIPFLTRLMISNPNFLWWKISTAIFIFLTVFVFLKNRREFPVALTGISFVFAVLSFFSIRNLSMYGILLIPLFFTYASILYKKPSDKKSTEEHYAVSVFISILILALIFINSSSRLPWNTNWGLGLLPENNKSAEFFKAQNINGPIFSNYDIGGYLIFHLYPKEKIFVDNRPEAYPSDFLQNEYIPMQEDETVWTESQNKWSFNVIYFYRHDYTPWAQQFLINRISDPSWAPVFVDNYTIIFLRRNPQNKEIIKNFELPKSIFSIKKADS